MVLSISEAQAELISSLAPDDIPIKLRCAICSKLAINAFRLPCCEQGICETCQSNLPPSCPVCEHSPLSAEDCNPNKSLRTTIRVFLRTAEKKREASRPKEIKEPAPPTPVEAPPQSFPAVEPSAAEPPPVEESSGENAHLGETASASNDTHETDSLQPTDQAVNGQGNTITQQDDISEPKVTSTDDVEGEPSIHDSNEQALVEKEDGGNQAGDDEENYDAEAINGAYPNANFSGSGDMNQMQMMMAMHNGMAPNAFGGGFPMMGMQGMSMDPMTMQNMFMNGGFQGMGMNGMGGFGGGFVQGGSNNNWNGSQSWNFDQNNYNQNGPGMGTGDFGNFNSGFQTGYNQGNYGQFNDYRRSNFGRGRGRGRGFYGSYGRGGYQFGGHANYQDQNQMSQFGSGVQGQGQGQSDNGGGGQAESAEGQDVDEYGRAVRAEVAEGDGKTIEAGQGDEPAAGDQDPSREALGNEATGDTTTNPSGPSGNVHQRNGSGSIRSVLAAPDVPINAPTGPKAMRQGLPNTSLLNLRARGYQVGGDAPPVKPHVPAQETLAERGRSKSNSPEQEKDKDNTSRHEQSKDRSRGHDRRDKEHDDREQENSGSRSRTASKSRSQSRGHRGSRRRRRHRSESVEDEGYDDESRRKKHKSRRHHHDEEEPSRSKDKDDKYTERSRSASPTDPKRSSHRSRRDRDYDKRRDREKDKYRDDDRKKSSSHRSSHRDRDRDYERDRHRDKDRDRKDRKDRHRDKDRDRDRDSRYSSRRHSTDGPDTAVEKDFKPPTGPRGHDIKGSSSKSDGATRDKDKDPHTLEREARDRERLLKEAQRIAGLGWKRSRDGDDDTGSGSRKGRRTTSSSTAAAGAGRRSEAVSGGDEEERMRRLEAEREGDRWR
ncbi:hypothetical protein QQZ08_008420 [Neonectria magnoliae]|uniref:RING-type domain-containing protein n=1 Tax=Neonectria magnoliae TaxID=2732573 RepID=A0ABR1HVN2_9HYPO